MHIHDRQATEAIREELNAKLSEAPTPHGLAGCATARAETPYCPPTLRERLQKQIHHSHKEQQTAWRAGELVELLNKNPEVARILELLEELGERRYE